MSTKHSVRCLLLSLISLTIVGCGDSDRPALARASGKVTLEGGPVAGATVTFVPVDGGRPATAMTNMSGVYVMNTFGDAEGAAVGDHFVSVMKVAGQGADMMEKEAAATQDDGSGDESATGDNALSPNLGGPDGETEDTVDIESLTDYLVPKRYMDPQNSGLQVTVPPEGSDRLDLMLVNE